jgi:hypothetical protein
MDLPLGFCCYCIDTSALLDLKKWYPQDIFETLWRDFEGLVNDGQLVAPKEVLAEIDEGSDPHDALRKWAKSHLSMFIDLDDEQIATVKGILQVFPGLADPSSTKHKADPFVIALAKSKGSTVVAQESLKPTPLAAKIPNACKRFKVEYLRLHDLFYKRGWKY